MLWSELASASANVKGEASRNEKISILAKLLASATPDERHKIVHYLSGQLPQGKIGIGPAAVRAAIPDRAASNASLSLQDVHSALSAIAQTKGAGSVAKRREQLGSVLERATEPGQRLLIGILTGGLRQGATQGVLVHAAAVAAKVDHAALARAHMLSGTLVEPVLAALSEGVAGLEAFRLTLFRPVAPMLAQTAASPADALETLGGRARLEAKLDGARVQVHRDGDRVEVYTRRLHRVTHAVPEVVEMVRDLPATQLILDGEVIALDKAGRPYPFQVTMRRFGRKLDVEGMRAKLPLSVRFFDVLYRDGQEWLDRPLHQRAEQLAQLVGDARVRAETISNPADAERFYSDTLDAGHEGVMAKAIDAAYEAGNRGHAWLKIKPAHTIDLVVVGAEWGSGRRKGWLSNLHLGALDEETGEFVIVGKTFKGLTDKMLEAQTQALLELETHRDDWTVYVRPERVIEVAFADVQRSPQYPAGLALRFARFKRLADKPPADIETVDQLRQRLGAVPEDADGL